MATGMVLIIVSRNIDLSVGSLLGFLGYTMAMVQTDGISASSASTSRLGLDDKPYMWIVALAVGLAARRARSARCRASSSPTAACPSFIVTLGGFLVWRGADLPHRRQAGPDARPARRHLPAARRRRRRARSASGGAGCSRVVACAGDRAQPRARPPPPAALRPRASARCGSTIGARRRSAARRVHRSASALIANSTTRPITGEADRHRLPGRHPHRRDAGDDLPGPAPPLRPLRLRLRRQSRSRRARRHQHPAHRHAHLRR